MCVCVLVGWFCFLPVYGDISDSILIVFKRNAFFLLFLTLNLYIFLISNLQLLSEICVFHRFPSSLNPIYFFPVNSTPFDQTYFEGMVIFL